MSFIVKKCPSFVGCCGCSSSETESARCINNKNCSVKALVTVLQATKSLDNIGAVNVAMDDALNLLKVEELE